ncbi:Glutathione transport system permease protein GsiD [bacterium HR27]|nr:Glutathione transport system permease protein GsiD [bacterium HR27]
MAEAVAAPITHERTRAVRRPIPWIGIIVSLVLALIVLTGLLGPTLSSRSPTATNAVARLKPPSATYPFGTDELGRDIFTRALYGLRTTLLIAVPGGLIGTVVGTALGLVGGYRRGLVDFLLQRGVEIVTAIPSLVVASVVVAVLGAGRLQLIGAVALSLTPVGVRVMRASALRVSESLFCEAARALGASHWRIMLRHVLPNCLGPVAVLASLNLGAAIFVETGLSFLGLGVQPPNPSLGNMLTGAASLYFTRAPWMVIFPGLIVTLLILCFNIIGDMLADYFDPRLRAQTNQ